MTDKEKLAELIHIAKLLMWGKSGFSNELARNSFIAEYLIANGVTVQRWIPVTERLPKDEGSYLVCTARGSVYVAHFYTEKRFHNSYIRPAGWSGKFKVTHWMPLPEPPKEVG